MSKNFPLVSVLINNYNKEHFCEEAINSALKQSYKNIEIIFYDDFSPDLSLRRVYNLKKKSKSKKIKILENTMRGDVYSFNQMEGIKRSLKKSKGQIVCILDSDDFFKRDKIKNVVSFFLKNKKEDIVFDKPILFYDTKNQTKSNRNYKIRSHKWPSFPSTSCISFRKKSLLKVLDKIYIDKYNELWFDFRVATYFAVKKKQFNLINEHLTFYRQGSSNYEKKYIKFINLKWWRRRYQAFQFLNFLDKAAYKKNIFSVDFIITNFIYKITSFV